MGAGLATEMADLVKPLPCLRCGDPTIAAPHTCGFWDYTVIYAVVSEVDPAADVNVEDTGGGCATIFVGPYDDDLQRYTVSIGPGWFNAHAAMFDPDDLYIGADDGDANYYRVRSLAGLRAYLRLLLHESAAG